MELLINLEVFNKCKSRDKIPLKCKACNKTFYKTKNRVQAGLKHVINQILYCSRSCQALARRIRIECRCKNCNKIFYKWPNQIKKTKNNFCCNKCAGLYNSKHVTKRSGSQRSKLEKWIEFKLKELYPNFTILYNDYTAIQAELDIYIPQLQLAFELNGIFHYEPIFGQDKLDKTQNNDKRKILACAEKSISLCVIDSSSLKYMKDDRCQKFLNIIINIINEKRIALM